MFAVPPSSPRVFPSRHDDPGPARIGVVAPTTGGLSIRLAIGVAATFVAVNGVLAVVAALRGNLDAFAGLF